MLLANREELFLPQRNAKSAKKGQFFFALFAFLCG